MSEPSEVGTSDHVIEAELTHRRRAQESRRRHRRRRPPKLFEANLFGSIPEEIARLSGKPVIVCKRHDTVKALFGRVMNE